MGYHSAVGGDDIFAWSLRVSKDQVVRRRESTVGTVNGTRLGLYHPGSGRAESVRTIYVIKYSAFLPSQKIPGNNSGLRLVAGLLWSRAQIGRLFRIDMRILNFGPRDSRHP